jgi:NAD(P)-dependent dehydrogenase (short-subunit alcohol dehydrogenase family)
MSQSKQVALVTGASTGIGLAAAEALVKAGFEVVGTSRDSSRITNTNGVSFIDLDVVSESSVEAAISHVVEKYGRLDVVVNNAGLGASGAAEENSLAQTQRILDVNFFGTVRVMNAVIPVMRQQRNGRIINISSVLGFVPAPFMAAYAASKHALEGFSESVDHEVREYGVRVLLVEPGYTKTSFEMNAAPPDNPLPVYAAQRGIFYSLMSEAMTTGDDPVLVAKSIVAAATDSKPKLRYPAGSTASKVSKLRRLVPAGAFDKQIRKLNKLSN